MANGSSIQIEGLDKLIKRLGRIPETVKTEIEGSLSSAAEGFVSRAVTDAPTDMGILKNQITYKKAGDMDYEVVSGSTYSAYVEFGTRTKFNAPAELQDYAKQFQGKGGGDYYDFLNAILSWVKRKGIVSRYSVKTKKEISKYSKDDNERLVQAAEAIAFSIIRNGIKPHPFFFKQMAQAQEEINRDLKTVVADALSK